MSTVIIDNHGSLLPENKQSAQTLSNQQVGRTARIIQSVTTINSVEEKQVLLESLATAHKPTIVSFVNAHAFNIAWDNAAFAGSLTQSDIVLRDGIGISLLMKYLGLHTGINMNGTDFIPQMIARFAGKRIAICGTEGQYLARAADKINRMGGRVVLLMDGFLPPETYAEHVKRSGADLIILGMGMPKQEVVSVLLAERMQNPAVIINGGAILDFLANRFARAPRIWQCLRIEWLFRLLQEPRRLWRRYLIGGAVFMARALKLRLSGRFPVK